MFPVAAPVSVLDRHKAADVSIRLTQFVDVSVSARRTVLIGWPHSSCAVCVMCNNVVTVKWLLAASVTETQVYSHHLAWPTSHCSRDSISIVIGLCHCSLDCANFLSTAALLPPNVTLSNARI